jgi:hypothetical protein
MIGLLQAESAAGQVFGAQMVMTVTVEHAPCIQLAAHVESSRFTSDSETVHRRETIPTGRAAPTDAALGWSRVFMRLFTWAVDLIDIDDESSRRDNY